VSVQAITPAVTAINEVAELLLAAGVPATRDPGALFHAGPVGVLVGLPSLAPPRLLAPGLTFQVPVTVVSGDPLNTTLAVDRLYALADDAALALSANAYTVTNFQSGVNAEPLPAILITVTVTVTETEEP